MSCKIGEIGVIHAPLLANSESKRKNMFLIKLMDEKEKKRKIFILHFLPTFISFFVVSHFVYIFISKHQNNENKIRV